MNGSIEKGFLEGFIPGREASSEDLATQEFTTVDELLRRPEPQFEWVWGEGKEGLMPAGKMALLAGATGEGKTTLAFHLAAAAADGRPFLSLPVRQMKRILIITETDEDQSIELFRDAFLATGGMLPENAKSITIGFPEELSGDKLVAKIAETQPELLILDSWTSIAPYLGWHRGEFDFYTAGPTTDVLKKMRAVRKAFDIKLWLNLMHTNKLPRDKEGNRINTTPHGDDIRGTPAIREQSDVAYVIKPAKGGKSGLIQNVKLRKRGTIESMKYLYDAHTGQYTGLLEGLTAETVIRAIREGHTSREAIRKRLAVNNEKVTRLIEQMIEDGKLRQVGAGRNMKLEVIE